MYSTITDNYLLLVYPADKHVTFYVYLTGLATLMAVFVLKIPDLGTEDVASAMDWIFAILFPNYCLGSGIMNVYTNYGYMEGCKATGYPLICMISPKNPCCPGKTKNKSNLIIISILYSGVIYHLCVKGLLAI